MSIEVATYIGDLQPVNPPSTDPRGQGDDHLRLIKTVLQNSFPSLERAIYFGAAVAKSANYSILAADMNSLFLLTTTAGSFTFTLPSTLASGDAGWTCRFLKVTTDVNPVFIAPATGTLTSGATSGLSSARRCIPGIEFKTLWTGTAWIVTRCQDLPVGSMIDFNSTGLPAGFEWPNGQTLASVATAYPEYNAAVGSGVTPDLRGRVAVTLDNLGGSAAGRLSGGIISGSTIGASGGTDTRGLITGNLPAYTPTGTIASSISFNSQVLTGAGVAAAAGVNSSGNPQYGNTNTLVGTVTSTFTGSAQGGSGTVFGILQPSLMCSKILIVE